MKKKQHFVASILFAMRLTIVQLALSFGLATTLLAKNTEAQAILNKSITLQVENVQIQKVISILEQQTQAHFSYSANTIRADRSISYSTVNKKLGDFFDEVLKPLNIGYKVVNDQIILYPLRKKAFKEDKEKIDFKTNLLISADFINLPSKTITGTILNEKGEPLQGASIKIKGSEAGTITNEAGVFKIVVRETDKVLIVSFTGYLSVEHNIGKELNIVLRLTPVSNNLENVVVVGYGTKKKEALTASISSITSADIENSHNGSTVSAELAGKIPGVTFRMSDSRPGGSASVQIRNMGDVLFIIDGIQQDAGQFNNIAPNDIESISVLKDASAAIYGVQAANGVMLITTKRGKVGSRNTINVAAYTGWQNWSRFPKTTNAYEWQEGRVESDVNQGKTPSVTPQDLAKYKAGTEKGYQSFDWYNFIVKGNAPLTQMNLNFTGGSDKINYYVSATHLKQQSVLGREFTFERSNIQSNIDVKVTKSLKIGAQINGRVETRDNPGVPGGDDYWEARFAILRNTPMERPYANDNPNYVNDIGHNNENWAYLNKNLAGHYHQDWRVLQSNLSAEYQTPLKGLTVKGLFSYYYANQILNNQEYTYKVYTFHPSDSTYNVTGGSSNPWRERTQQTILSPTIQLQADYNRTFGKHSIDVTFVNERTSRRDQNNWVHAVPTTNSLPLIYFPTMDTYNDGDVTTSRIGYVGRISYNYDNKYYIDFSGRRDASYILSPDHKWGNFPSVSAGWRIAQEGFFKKLVDSKYVNELKLRVSYGLLGDDRPLSNYINEFSYLQAYNYNSSTVILNGSSVIGSNYAGVPVTSITWIKSHMLDIGLDFSILSGKVTGTFDYFRRKRDGIPAGKYDVLVPSELGYSLPVSNANSDGVVGAEGSLAYNGKIQKVNFTVNGNLSVSRPKTYSTYKPTFYNSWDNYKNSNENRPNNLYWGYECIGQFTSQEQISKYAVNEDGQGNKTLLPGDLIYKDLNGDGIINDYDTRPIGWGGGTNPIVNFGLNFAVNWHGFDVHADFSGGSGYSYNRNWEMRWPYQNGGALQSLFYNDHWHHADAYDPNSAWVPGKYPAFRFNTGDHNDYNKNSTFWLVNIHYIRCRTLEFGYSLPKELLNKAKIQNMRVYVNANNLFSLDNVHNYGIDAEIVDENGLTYPQSKYVNVGISVSF